MTLENSFVTYQNWGCSSGAVQAALSAAESAAVNRVGINNYTIDTNLSDNNGVDATCGVYNNGFWWDKFIDVKTMITADTASAFAHFVFSGALRNTVTSIARIRPRAPLAFGNAIVALRENCPNSNTGGVHFVCAQPRKSQGRRHRL